MAVLVFWIVPFDLPFLQLSPASNGRFQEILPHGRNMVPELLILTQGIGSLDGVGEQIVNEFLVIGHALFGFILVLFGRPTVWCNESTIGTPLQMVLPEVTDFFENGIGGFAQVVDVTTKGIMLP
ncbi:hypothetical protein CA13_74120 [Planctomycetes bacterium CA13]|uniref:Uncharacterized protein n=1 Tax=Novipirellula herctigrandis TaxID=2527986 RepID=A0A5C5YIJ7_9BACT|nr:hypothetical protein CA13_74120 [Planctomycetes bacterium CA13]